MMIIVFLIVVFLFTVPPETSAQLSYKFKLESGMFFNSVESIYDETNTNYKILANVKYKLKLKESESSISLKIRPELFDNDFHSVKYGAQGNYIFYDTNIKWKSMFSYQFFDYTFSDNSSNISSFSFLSGAEFNLFNKNNAIIILGYSFQNFDFIKSISSDNTYLDTKIKNPINNYLNLSYGLFIEHFTTENNFRINNLTDKTKGWYFGPQVSVNYLRKFVFNLDYKFLILSSTNLLFPSHEHRINALCGLLLSKQISFFLLVDFCLRKTELKNLETNSNFLLPTKNENHVSLKLNYKLLKRFSLYVKGGYFRENLLLEDEKLEGLNVMLGFELKN